MRDDVVLSEAWKISRKIILYFRISAHQVRLQLADCRKVHSHVVGGNCCCCCSSSQESDNEGVGFMYPYNLDNRNL